MPSPARSLRLALPVLLAFAVATASAQSMMPDPGAMADGSMAVARLSDAEASCEQLYAEANHLERMVAAMPKPEDPATLAMKMQADMREAQKKMIAGQRARSVGTSLLSLVPGAGMVAGAVSSLGSRGTGTAAFDKTLEDSMRAQHDSMEAMMAMSRLQARQGYVTRLFVERGCKPSQLDAAAVAAATNTLAGHAAAPDRAPAAASIGGAGQSPAVDARSHAEAVPQAPPEDGAAELAPAPTAPRPATRGEAGTAQGVDATADASGA